MTTYPDYDKAIPVPVAVILGVTCVQCNAQGTPIVWTIIINGNHFTRCDNCNIIMKPEAITL
ncbi:hypothetical protein ACFC1L_39710 [Streptomyces sp. NPDC056210]|uniref:hypothetical protein n=1 Tax=Streptomyces sp. NPDC056210 TaxID=3345746 RepID=UPI0035DCAC39